MVDACKIRQSSRPPQHLLRFLEERVCHHTRLEQGLCYRTKKTELSINLNIFFAKTTKTTVSDNENNKQSLPFPNSQINWTVLCFTVFAMSLSLTDAISPSKEKNEVSIAWFADSSGIIIIFAKKFNSPPKKKENETTTTDPIGVNVAAPCLSPGWRQ